MAACGPGRHWGFGGGGSHILGTLSKENVCILWSFGNLMQEKSLHVEMYLCMCVCFHCGKQPEASVRWLRMHSLGSLVAVSLGKQRFREQSRWFPPAPVKSSSPEDPSLCAQPAARPPPMARPGWGSWQFLQFLSAPTVKWWLFPEPSPVVRFWKVPCLAWPMLTGVSDLLLSRFGILWTSLIILTLSQVVPIHWSEGRKDPLDFLDSWEQKKTQHFFWSSLVFN